MRIRVKFGSRRLPVVVTAADERITVTDVIRCASEAFQVGNDDKVVSLNGEDFSTAAEGNLDVASWGLVPGDLVYLRSKSQMTSTSSTASDYVTADTSPTTLSRAEPIPRLLNVLMETNPPRDPLQCLALAIFAIFSDAGFQSPPNEIFEPRWSSATSVIRLHFFYVSSQFVSPEKAPVTVTLVDMEQCVTASVQVVPENAAAVIFTVTFNNRHFVVRDGERFCFAHEDELCIQIRDELLEKIRQELHTYFGLMPVGLLRLPNELQFRILRLLDRTALGRVEQCCSHYRRLTPHVWRFLFQRDFPKEFEGLKDTNVSDWKIVYREFFERAEALARARRHMLQRTDTFHYVPGEEWIPDLLPLPAPPLLRPPVPPERGILGGIQDLWPVPLLPQRPPLPSQPPFLPFRPWRQ